MPTSRFSLSEGLALVADFKASGLSQTAFSQQAGISPFKLRYWISKSKALSPNSSVDKPSRSQASFVPLAFPEEAVGQPVVQTRLRVQLAPSVELHFDQLPPVDYLAALLELSNLDRC